MRALRAAFTLSAALLFGCGPSEPAELVVRHPDRSDSLPAVDSTYVNGTVAGFETSRVRVTVDGTEARVHPDGGWIAWVPVARGESVLDVRATEGDRAVEVDVPIRTAGVALPYRRPSIPPDGRIVVPPGDTLPVRISIREGWEASARLGDRRVPLVRRSSTDAGRKPEASAPRGWSALPSARGASEPPLPPARERWSDVEGTVPVPRRGGELVIELARNGERHDVIADVTVDPGLPRTGRIGSSFAGIVGRRRSDGERIPLASGTVVTVRRLVGDEAEIALGPADEARIPADAIVDAPAVRPRVEGMEIRGDVDGWTELAVAISERVPFRVEERLDPAGVTVRLYGAVRGPRTGSTAGGRVREARGSRSPAGYTIEIVLDHDRSWGYRIRWEGTHLLLGVRTPPGAGSEGPLDGMTIVVDPGHGAEPGAIGPTGLEEREVTWSLAAALGAALEERGARVVLTRSAPREGISLTDRVGRAVEVGGDVFVSLHADAIPPGRNPFVPRGSSVLYHRSQSRWLAELVRASLQERIALPDGGLARRDLAVLRMTEMPSILVETAFLTLPEQEALLRTETFRRAVAEGIATGIERYARKGRRTR